MIVAYFFCVLTIALFLYFIQKFNIIDNNLTTNNNYKHLPPVVQTIFQKHDCDVETIYSFTDQHCRDICKSQNNNYISRHGICVNLLAFQNEQVTNTCDPKRGVLAYLTGNSQFGSVQLKCLTIDDGIQPSDLSKPNIFCTNGKIDVNYLASYPQIPDCKCLDTQIQTIIANTNSVRSRVICVDKKFKDFYDVNSLVVTPNTV